MQSVLTHNGSFDPDDVLAVAVVTMYLGKGNYEVIRSRSQAEIDQADWVVDVGGVYDKERRRFDHHQNGVPKRGNGIPYSSLGLVWDEIGEELCGSADIARTIEEKLVYPIDAADNNLAVCCDCGLDVHSYEFFDVINTFKPVWGSDEDFYTGFMRAVSFARKLMRRQIAREQGEKAMIDYATSVYEAADNKEAVVFEKPVSRHSLNELTELKKYAAPVFTENSDNWSVNAVPDDYQGFANRAQFPESWAGLSGAELETVSGITGAIFCHKERYMFVAASKEAALKALSEAV